MRKILLLVMALVALQFTVLPVAPAAANSYQGLNTAEWFAPNGRDILIARIAIEVDSSGSSGWYRIHLYCEYFDDIGRRHPQQCQFYWDHSAPNAFWCFGTGSSLPCYSRSLSDHNYWDYDHYWLGTPHTLTNGTSYVVIAANFKAKFSSGYTGAYHDIASDRWTR
jgi:hypothetical protein